MRRRSRTMRRRSPTSPENPEDEVYDEHPDDVFRIKITLRTAKDELRGLLWEEQYINEALARGEWDGGIMDGSIERVSTRVRSRMDLHIRSPPWDHLAPADLFVDLVLKQVSHRNTGDRTLEIITMPAAGFWVLYPPPANGASHINPFFLNLDYTKWKISIRSASSHSVLKNTWCPCPLTPPKPF